MFVLCQASQSQNASHCSCHTGWGEVCTVHDNCPNKELRIGSMKRGIWSLLQQIWFLLLISSINGSLNHFICSHSNSVWFSLCSAVQTKSLYPFKTLSHDDDYWHSSCNSNRKASKQIIQRMRDRQADTRRGKNAEFSPELIWSTAICYHRDTFERFTLLDKTG